MPIIIVSVVVRRYIYRYPYIPYSYCICSFLQQHPYFLNVSFLFQYIFVIYVIIFSRSKHKGRLPASQGSHMKG